MTDPLAQLARQQLAQIRAQLAEAEAVLARIRAHGNPQHAEKEASTRQMIDALSSRAEAMAQQLGVDPPRVLH